MGMRGYPLGTLLFWNTKDRPRYRPFLSDYAGQRRHGFRVKDAGNRASVVLDGQQRLQSLYVADCRSIF